MDEINSKDYSWARVTGDRMLCDGPCDLLFAYLVTSGATTDTVLRNGTDAAGEAIVTLKSAVVTGHDFNPPVPVFLDKGLFVDFGTSVSEVFVIWRKLK